VSCTHTKITTWSLFLVYDITTGVLPGFPPISLHFGILSAFNDEEMDLNSDRDPSQGCFDLGLAEDIIESDSWSDVDECDLLEAAKWADDIVVERDIPPPPQGIKRKFESLHDDAHQREAPHLPADIGDHKPGGVPGGVPEAAHWSTNVDDDPPPDGASDSEDDDIASNEGSRANSPLLFSDSETEKDEGFADEIKSRSAIIDSLVSGTKDMILMETTNTHFYLRFTNLTAVDTFLDLYSQTTGEKFQRVYGPKNFGNRGNISFFPLDIVSFILSTSCLPEQPTQKVENNYFSSVEHTRKWSIDFPLVLIGFKGLVIVGWVSSPSCGCQFVCHWFSRHGPCHMDHMLQPVVVRNRSELNSKSTQPSSCGTQ
jgi:hypothetical protein